MDLISVLFETDLWLILVDVLLVVLFIVFLLVPGIDNLYKSDLFSAVEKKRYLLLILLLPGFGLALYYWILQGRRREKYKQRTM